MLWWMRGSNQSGQSWRDLPVPGDLDTAFVELVEGVDFDLPESFTGEIGHVWIAGITAAVWVLASQAISVA
jgi:hypothetical protein